MNAILMKRLFRVIQSGTSADVDTLCRRIVEEEKKQGHGLVAKELEQILSAERLHRGSWSNVSNLSRKSKSAKSED
jgi:hypothetical protein